MTFAAEKLVAGRRPLAVVEIDLNTCSLTYGIAPCTAALAAGSECYNTRATCQDWDNFASTTTTYRFCEAMEGLPAGVEMFPCLRRLDLAPAKITPGEGLGYRGAVTVELQDFSHHDRGIDPYVDDRSYDPASQGTFFGKLFSRNPYWQLREMRIRTGYLTDTWNWNNFRSRVYVIDTISGPDASGRVRIIAKDILKLADDDKSQCPVASEGSLNANITAGATSLTLKPAGIGADYGTSGRLRISSELIDFSGRISDTPTGLTRGVGGSAADSHDEDDLVQLCYVVDGENVTDVVEDLLANYAGVDASYIPSADWATEESTWLAAFDLHATISEPTGVRELLEELTAQCLFELWWDDVEQEIILRALAPPGATEVLDQYTDAEHILDGSVSVKDEEKLRLSQVWVYYDKIDLAGDDKPENFRALIVEIETNAEGADQYGTKRVRQFFGRWFDATNTDVALTLASRTIARFRAVPKRIKFSIDAKDIEDLTLGSIAEVVTRQIQGVDGANFVQQIQVVSLEEVEPASIIKAEALSSEWRSRYAYVADNTAGEYSAETDANKLIWAFVAPDTNIFPDGKLGYSII